MKNIFRIISTELNKLKQKGSFAQNFAVTFSGTAAVAIIGLLITPIMSRLYAPAAYGLFAVFNSIVANASLFSTFTYPSAFLLPRLAKKFNALVQLTLLLSAAMLLIMVLVVSVVHRPLLRWLNAEALGGWVYVIPFTIYLYSLMGIMVSWYLRTKDFKKRAGIEVGTTLVGRLGTLSAGILLHGSSTGLLLGDIFAKIVSVGTMYFSGIHLKLGDTCRHLSWTRLKHIAFEYREYPFFVLPAGYLNMIASQMPVFFLTSSFGTTAVGLYAFSTSLMELPINVIGNAIAPVFLQKATETYQQDPERLKQICLDLYNKLLYLGLLPFGIITVYGDWIFKFAFGARWEQAGVFTAYLGYYYIFKLASYATSPIYAVFRKQRTVLLGTALLVLCRAASLTLGTYAHDLNLGMLLFGVSSLVITFLIDMHILHLLKLPVLRVAIRSILLVLVTLAVLKGLRIGLVHFFG